jgi:hypothetical protein
VVIAIIALLTSLGLSAVFKAIQLVRRGNTERTMEKVFKRFDVRMQNVNAQAKSADLPTYPVTLAPIPPTVLLSLDQFSCSAGNALNPIHTDPELERRRARVLYLKYLTKVSFPMNFVEIQFNARIQDPAGNPIQPDPFAVALFQRFNNMFKPDPTGTWNYVDPNGFRRARNADTELGACLALVYAQLGTLDDLSAGEAIMEDTSNLATGWNDGIPRICDAWGTPMRAYRWPVGYVNVGGSPLAFGVPPGTDPQDPEHLMDHVNQSTGAMDWRQNFGPIFTANYHEVGTYAPLTLVSAGPDRLFGLDPPPANWYVPDPMRVTPALRLDELDNLYSFRFRIGVVQQGQ